MTRSRVAVALATALACVPVRTAVGQARWLTVYRDGGVVLGVDTVTARQVGSAWDVWVRWTYSSPQKAEKGKTYRTAKTRQTIDCAGRRMRSLASYSYGGDGSVVQQYEPDSALATWSSVIPDTRGEALLNGFCADTEFFDGSHAEKVEHWLSMLRVLDSSRTAGCKDETRTAVVVLCRKSQMAPHETPAQMQARWRVVARLDSIYDLVAPETPPPWPRVLP